MNNLVPLFLVVLLLSCNKESGTPNPTPAVSDSSLVTVINGYGSGKYKTDDTVHIFSLACSENQLFNTWTVNGLALNGKDEWHTWFIMPATNVTVTGSLKNINPFTLTLEQISGRDRLKPVYYYFPAGHKGFVLLLHGSGGTAQHFINSFEYQLLIKDLVIDNFGVIITESEESTTGIDANADGKIRWNTQPYDSVTNVDYANIRIITESFYSRGITTRNKFRYSVGMSNGGNYSAWLSSLYNYKAGVSYCAPAGASVLFSSVPLQFCMARFDNHENVGPAGNANALENSQALITRGICSKFLMNEHSPLYPERFARKADISIAKSINIFNELKTKGFLDTRNYFKGFSDQLTTAFQANPASFPEINSLSILQRLTVMEQIDLAVSDHQMYSDYNRATLRFLNNQCQ